MRQLFFCSQRRTQRIKTIFRQLKLAVANQRLALTNFESVGHEKYHEGQNTSRDVTGYG